MENFLINKRLNLSGVTGQVTNIIRDAIFDGELRPGDKLPNEYEIARHLGISRASVREAHRELKSAGLLQTRRGVMGGTFVAQTDPARILDLVLQCYRVGSLSLSEVVEFRRVVEPVVLELACQHRTEEDLKAMLKNLKSCRRALEEGWVHREKQIAFHNLIAEACHNRLISVVMKSVTLISWEFTSQWQLSVKHGWLDYNINWNFYDCLLNRRSEGAQKLVHEHYAMTIELEKQFQRKLEQKAKQESINNEK